jgi:PAS domain S-box-containing protein
MAQEWSEQKFRTLIEHSSDAVSLIDAQGIILYKSPCITKIAGFTPEELVGHNAFEVVHPDDREPLLLLFRQLLEHPEKTLSGEFRHLHKDGSYRWVEGVASNMLAEPAVAAIVFNFRDITERKRIESLLEQKLKQLEAAKQDLDEQNRALTASQTELEFERRRYLDLFDLAPDGYLVTDLNGLIQEVNLAACRILRQSSGFLRHLPLVQFFVWEDRQRLRDLVSRLQQSPREETESIEVRLRGGAGPTPCSITINTVPGPERTGVVGLRWLIRDVTELKRVEQALHARDTHLQVLTATMPAVPWSATPEGKIEYFSNKWLEWTGLTSEQIAGGGWKEVVHPEDLPGMEATANHSVQTGEPFDCEHRLRRPNGQFRWYRSRALPQRDANGKIVSWHGITDDIHELKTALEAVRQSENELRQSQQRLRLALGSAAMGFYERDVATNRAVYDAQCRAILGLPEGVSTPEAAKNLVHPEDRPRILAALEKALSPASRKTVSEEFRIIRPDGLLRWVNASGCALFDERSEPPRAATMMGVVQDITPRKLAEEELKRAQARLARHNEELEQTVARRTAELQEIVAELEHMSYSIIHDLRAPLRAIAGYTDILRRESDKTLNEGGRNLLQLITTSAARMDLLIRDALSYSKTVRTQLALVPLDAGRVLQPLLKSSPEFLPPLAEIQVDGNLPSVLANEAGLTQCFSNLLDNATKFVEPGRKPHVRIWAETSGEVARLWFEDNGIGIPRDSQHKIFDMFQRMHGSAYEGTGIGLALVRKVMERMGGRVGVESEVGKGSRFWLELRRPPTGRTNVQLQLAE